MLSYRAQLIFASCFLTTLILSGCGENKEQEKKIDAQLEFENASLVNKRVFAQSYSYIFNIKSNLSTEDINSIKKMSEKLTKNTIIDNRLKTPNIVIYFFKENQQLPVASGYYPSHSEFTDYIYEGDHGRWSYIYMHPLIGEPKWVSCEESESALCK